MRIVRTVKPQVLLCDKLSQKAYRKFSTGENTTLLSYSWNKDLYTFGGAFTLTIKDDGTDLIDDVQMLDVVQIIENETEKADFIGIITAVTYNASATGKKQISIQGKSIESLLDMFTIALDATAMIFAGKSANNASMQLNFAKDLSSQKKPLTIKNVLEIVFDKFEETAGKFPNVSSTTIGEMIKKWIGEDFFEVPKEDGKETEFKYPISSNLIQNATITYPGYIRNLLPQPLYELYGETKDGSTKVICRKVPFGEKDWKKLIVEKISPDTLTNFVLGRNCEEVYTAFIPYLEGSNFSPNFYQVKNGSKEGYKGSNINTEKLKVYGYRPLNCDFHGYKMEGTTEEQEGSLFENTSKELSEWYGYLDDMYNANFSIINIINENKPVLGGIAQFGEAKFYVTGVEHTWSYGDTAMINYQCERGGLYSEDGKFQPVKKFQKLGGYLL